MMGSTDYSNLVGDQPLLNVPYALNSGNGVNSDVLNSLASEITSHAAASGISVNDLILHELINWLKMPQKMAKLITTCFLLMLLQI